MAAAQRTLPAAIGAALAAPQARISVAVVTRDAARRLDCFRVAGDRDRLVAVTPQRDGAAAVSLVDGALPEAMIVEALGLDAPLAAFDHESGFDVAALWALAALADAQRQRELESLLARSPSAPPGIDADTVYLRALDGAATPDPRWLSGLLTRLMGAGDVTEAAIAAGLTSLARAGLIAEQAGLWSAHPAFAATLAHLQVPLAGARLAVATRADGGVANAAVVLLRTLAVTWLIDADAGGAARLRAIDGAGARHALRAIMAPAPGPDATAGGRFCPGCGRPAAPGDRFCGHCGTALG